MGWVRSAIRAMEDHRYTGVVLSIGCSETLVANHGVGFDRFARQADHHADPPPDPILFCEMRPRKKLFSWAHFAE